MRTFIFFVKIGLGAGQEALAVYAFESDEEHLARNEFLGNLEREYPLSRFPGRKYLKTVTCDGKNSGNSIFTMFLNGHRQGEVE